MAVEAEAQPSPAAFHHADCIRPVDFDILANAFETIVAKPIEDELANLLLLAGRARNAGEVGAKARQLVTVDLRQDLLCRVAVKCHVGLPRKMRTRKRDYSYRLKSNDAEPCEELVAGPNVVARTHKIISDCLAASAEMAGKERFRDGIEGNVVGRMMEAMAFIRKDN